MKIKTIFKILKEIMYNPNSLSLVLNENRSRMMEEYVLKKYDLKFGLPTIDFLDLFHNFLEEITPLSFLPHGSLETDYALLKCLARTFEKCRYLEIGAGWGESVANVSSVADDCVSLSLSDEEMRKEGYSDQFIKTSRFFSKNLPNVTVIGHNSQTFDFSTIGKFDLIFVDGDHSYEAIKKDSENVFKLLKNEKSIIVWHDYLQIDGGLIRWPTLAAILDGCPAVKRRNLYHISNTMSAAYIPGKFKTVYTKDGLIPNKIFTSKLSVSHLKNNNKKIRNQK